MAPRAPLDDWEQMVRVNVLGMLYMAHAALPHLLKAAADGPRYVADLVNVSSRLGRVASAGFDVYNLTKFGEVAFSESLRQEVTKRHVRVAAVEPGIVATEIRSRTRPQVRVQVMQRFASGVEPLAAEDTALWLPRVPSRGRIRPRGQARPFRGQQALPRDRGLTASLRSVDAGAGRLAGARLTTGGWQGLLVMLSTSAGRTRACPVAHSTATRSQPAWPAGRRANRA